MTQAQFKPLAQPAESAFRSLGIGKSKGWELVKAGFLDARKIGRRTVITTASLESFMENLPRVKARPAQESA